MANDPSGAAPKGDAPNPKVNPQVATAADVRTPDPPPAPGVGGDPQAAAEGRPTPGISADAPAADAPKVPHADPMPGTVKETQPGKSVSGSMHGEKYITVLGTVDHPRLNSDGSITNVHTPGMIQVLNPKYAQDEGIDPNEDNKDDDKSPEDVKAANPAGTPLNPRITAVAAAPVPGGPPAPGAPQPTGKAGDVQAPPPRDDAKSVAAKPAK